MTKRLTFQNGEVRDADLEDDTDQESDEDDTDEDPS